MIYVLNGISHEKTVSITFNKCLITGKISWKQWKHQNPIIIVIMIMIKYSYALTYSIKRLFVSLYMSLVMRKPASCNTNSRLPLYIIRPVSISVVCCLALCKHVCAIYCWLVCIGHDWKLQWLALTYLPYFDKFMNKI